MVAGTCKEVFRGETGISSFSETRPEFVQTPAEIRPFLLNGRMARWAYAALANSTLSPAVLTRLFQDRSNTASMIATMLMSASAEAPVKVTVGEPGENAVLSVESARLTQLADGSVVVDLRYRHPKVVDWQMTAVNLSSIFAVSSGTKTVKNLPVLLAFFSERAEHQIFAATSAHRKDPIRASMPGSSSAFWVNQMVRAEAARVRTWTSSIAADRKRTGVGSRKPCNRATKTKHALT